MRRLLFVCGLLVLGLPAWAGRVLPQNMHPAVLKEVAYPTITVKNESTGWLKILTLGLVDVSRQADAVTGVRIRDTNNRFLTRNRLPKFIGEPVGLLLNQEQLVEIWILTPKEDAELRSRGKHEWPLEANGR